MTQIKLGDLLRRHRLDAVLKQTEVAQLTGYNHTYVSRVERNEQPPSREYLMGFMEGLRLSADECAEILRLYQAAFAPEAVPSGIRLPEELFPKPTQPAKQAQSCHNLPPRYGDFFGRQTDLMRVFAGVTSRWPLLAIEGMGGIGKTTLAVEAAYHCLPDGKLALDDPFDACVFISAKDQPIILDDLLNTIAYVLNYPYILQKNSSLEKSHEVASLLHAQRVLILVDNFETVTDQALVHYLQQIPEPSKAIITTRYGQLRRVWDVHLDGLAKPEALEFIRHHAQRLELATLSEAADADLEPLIAVTGGNPYALETALGYLRYGKLALNTLVNALYRSSEQVDEIFDYIFHRAWQVLNQDAQSLLMVMPLFVDSATKVAIGMTAGLKDFYLDRGIEQLVKMSLCKVNDALEEDHRRYMIHPLTLAFAKGKLLEEQAWALAARKRWLEWAAEFASNVSWCWDDECKLDILEREEKNIYAALEWAVKHQDNNIINELIIRIAYGVDHYYYVRGPWDKKIAVDQMRIEAARRLGRVDEEARALAQHIQLLCTKGDIQDAEKYLARLDTVKQSGIVDPDIFTQVQHAYAFYAMAHHEFDYAYQLLEQCKRTEPQPSQNLAIATLHWLATCLYRKGLLADAERCFKAALKQAEQAKYQRSMIYCQLSLGKISLEQGQLESAETFLQESLKAARSLKELRYTAQIQLARVRLYIQREDYSAANSALAEAKELFKWLGLKDDQETLEQVQMLVASKS